MLKPTPLAGAIALACAAAAQAQQAPAASAAPDTTMVQVATAAPQTVEITGARAHLDAARNTLSPDTGSTTYRFDSSDIAQLPLGDATPLNQLVLRTPGAVQDSYGELHVRGDHGNLQYRINGVVIPEAISGFGQALDTRFASQVNVFTGALPAQYGYRTAEVIDIRTKGDAVDKTGSLDFTFGSHAHREAGLSVSGSSGAWSYFGVGSYLQDDLGIENPTPSTTALHDVTHQGKGFGMLSYVIDDNHRISLMAGASNNRFEIPDVPGESPSFTLSGTTPPASDQLDARQRERNDFEVLAYQGTSEAFDYQLAVFHRLTDVHYQPDPVGDLTYNGVASDVLRRNLASGLQTDVAWRLNPQHTLRTGVFLQHERATVDNTSQVFPADASGNQTGTTPLTIVDNGGLGGNLQGVYLQDEYKPTQALTVNYGLRYDHVTTVGDESQWSPRLGLVYQLGPDTRIHGGYARYFTPPPTEKIDTTSVGNFQGTTNALPSDANTAVKSERSNYYDLGIAHDLGKHVTLSADAYYRDVRHLQDEGQFGNALIFSAFNYQRGRIGGLELAGTYKDERWSAYANLAFSRAMGEGIETGQFNFDPDELAYIQQHWVHLDHDQTVAVSTGASYKLADGTQLGLDALYGSGLRNGFANTGHLPSYTTVDANAARSFSAGAFGKIEARLTLENVFDRVYLLRDGSGIGVGAPQYGARRGAFLSLSKPFAF
jgi:outer membrane receptor protein involved in Fe transport